MDDDREAFEFAYALHLARRVDREAAQIIVEAAEAGKFSVATLGRRLNCITFDPAAYVERPNSAMNRAPLPYF